MTKKYETQGARIIRRYNAGDQLTDLEVAVGIEMMLAVEQATIKLGPVFELARREASRLLIGLNDIYYARKR